MGYDKSEFELIEWLRRQGGAGGEAVVVGIGDDMAVLEVGSEKVLITTDMLLEGVHFELAKASLEQVGYKAVACSLSDCAAMAVRPWAAVVSAALSGKMSMEEAQQLHRGLQRAADKYNCPLVGGDTTSWDRLLAINVTMLAKAKDNEPVLRSGAQVGDAIMVTGQLGGSRTGKHLNFEPRVNEALMLARMVELHAMIDISDGLSMDLDHICQESKAAAIIDAAAVPVSAAAQRAHDPLAAALADGEDFELLFCVSQKDAEKMMKEWPGQSKLELSKIGEIIEYKEGARMYLRDKEGKLEALVPRGWEHFKKG